MPNSLYQIRLVPGLEKYAGDKRVVNSILRREKDLLRRDGVMDRSERDNLSFQNFQKNTAQNRQGQLISCIACISLRLKYLL